jgi:predicted DNA binding protein
MIEQENAPVATGAKNINTNRLKVMPNNGTGLLEDIVSDVMITAKPNNGLFSVKSANAWIDEAKMQPQPTPLFDLFWFLNELCILFADSNAGKSILAVLIANIIAEIQKVLYFDFELSGKQFEARYSNDYTNHYHFPENFYRAEIDPDGEYEGFESFEDYLIHSLEKVVIETGVKILIIDNITYLKNETDKAKNALPLMKQLKALKQKYNLSILVLAHTPKRDLTKPITQNDLQGSKMIMNFCDSAFAIGVSTKDASIRYLKQLKSRNAEIKYHADNVKVYQIVKPDNFLQMDHIGFGSERDHLKIISDSQRDEMKHRATELQQAGWSIRKIAEEIGVSVSTTHKYLNNGIK